MWNRLADKTWNRVERGCAPVVQVLVIYAIYLGGLLWLLTLPERDRYIDVGFALAQLIVSAWVLAVALLLLGIGLVLRVRKPDSLLYQHVGAQFFALTLVWSGYVTGMQSFATGVVLIGAALAGYIDWSGASFSSVFSLPSCWCCCSTSPPVPSSCPTRHCWLPPATMIADWCSATSTCFSVHRTSSCTCWSSA